MRLISERAVTIRSISMAVCFVSMAIVFAGCGGGGADIEKVPLYPAGGTVKLDGEPFGPVSLRLVPEESGARSFVAQVDDQGNINTVTTYEIGDGAPAGTYKVTVFSSGGTGKKFPTIYESENSTPLKVVIADIQGEGANAMDIQLDSKAGRGKAGDSTMGHFDSETMEAAKAGAN